MATAIFQIVVALLSGSVALLSDTFHNFGDASTAIPLGIASYVIWRVNNSWRMTDEERAQLAGDAYDVEAAPAT